MTPRRYYPVCSLDDSADCTPALRGRHRLVSRQGHLFCLQVCLAAFCTANDFHADSRTGSGESQIKVMSEFRVPRTMPTSGLWPKDKVPIHTHILLPVVVVYDLSEYDSHQASIRSSTSDLSKCPSVHSSTRDSSYPPELVINFGLKLFWRARHPAEAGVHTLRTRLNFRHEPLYDQPMARSHSSHAISSPAGLSQWRTWSGD